MKITYKENENLKEYHFYRGSFLIAYYDELMDEIEIYLSISKHELKQILDIIGGC